MNVASLELCKELYELSGHTWHEEIIYSWHKDDGNYVVEDFWSGSICPAYDLGYLFRKLPTDCLITVYEQGKTYYGMKDTPGAESTYDVEAITPEDAACKLAIELFKQGILKGLTEGGL